MRAFTQWLALAPLFVIAGCSTLQQTPREASSESPLSLSEADANLGEALAHYSQGLVSEASLGTAQSAFFHFKQSAVLDPSNIPLSLKVAADYIGRKDYTGAVSILKSLELKHPDSVEIRLLLGSVYQAQDQQDEAVRSFRSVIRLVPDRPDGYIRLATLWAMEFDSRRTLAVIREGLRHVDNPLPLVDFSENVGRLFMAGKELSGAIPFFELVLLYRPDDLPIRVNLALLHLQRDHFAKALTQFDAVARYVGKDESRTNQLPPLFYFWYGSACERAGRVVEGEQYLSRYLAANPDSAETLNYLAYVWAERGVNLERAEIYIKKALQQEPENGAYWDTQGWIQYKQGDYGEAVKSLNQALRLTGDDPAILDHLRAVRAALKKR